MSSISYWHDKLMSQVLCCWHTELELRQQAAKQTRAQKRRGVRAAEEAEREARIAEEQATLGESDRAAEARELQALLDPLGLVVRDILVRLNAVGLGAKLVYCVKQLLVSTLFFSFNKISFGVAEVTSLLFLSLKMKEKGREEYKFL